MLAATYFRLLPPRLLLEACTPAPLSGFMA